MSVEKLQLSVIIVSYNTCDMTIECLQTLSADVAQLDAEIWVVDNGSSDGTVTAIRERFPTVRIVENPRNAGFGAANNLAMEAAQGEFFLLLNSDAFPRAGAIPALLDCARRHPRAAVVGPRLLNRDGSLQVSCYRFPSPSRAWLENLWLSAALPRHPRIGDYRFDPHDREKLVDWLVGACIVVRREAYREVGGFDEKFFMYQEETDWQKRMQTHGWDIVFTPAAEVTHYGGASGDSVKISRHFFDSLDYYEWKHHGMLGLLSLRMAMAIGCSLRAVMWAAVGIVIPRKRAAATAKTRLHSWLFLRQMTHWRLSLR